ncbi:MAG: peptidoglycan-binding protein [Pseudorhodoplanes sp.]|uniref:peptidoglycan-binding domain-containing protein n=1 Tax=Pseudorhodoplanes sp. TaxID=1934341 RepID=UPI003D136534
MKSLMLATVATFALAMPAVAADRGQSGTMDPTRTQSQQQSSQQWSQQQKAQSVSPSELDQSQIRQIQQALNKHGFDAGNVDGVWGPETRDAVQNFQEKRNLSTDEALNEETLSALGVDFASSMNGGGASTTGSGSSETTGSGFNEPADSNLEASDMDGNPQTSPSAQ